MSSRWFYQLLTQEFGPVSIEQLHDLLQTGILASDDLVRSEDSTIPIPISVLLNANGDIATTSDSKANGGIGKMAGISDLSELAFEFEDSGPTSRRQTYPQPPAVQSSLERSSLVSADPTGSPHEVASAEQWYCDSKGNIMGPMPFDVLIGLAESGVIDPSTGVRCGERGVWKQADCLPKLMRAIALHKSHQPDQPSELVNENTTPQQEPTRQQEPAPTHDVPTPTPESKNVVPRQRRRSAAQKENALLEEIFNDVFNQDVAPVKAEKSSLATTGNPQTPIIPATNAPAHPSAKATPSIAAMAGLAEAATKQSSARSSRSSNINSRSIVVLVGILLLLTAGFAYWKSGNLAGVATGNGPFDKANAVRTLNEAMARFKAIGPNPSEVEWTEFSSTTLPQMKTMFKSIHERAGATNEGVHCLKAIRSIMKISMATPDQKEIIDESLVDYESSMAKLQQ